MPGLGSDDPSVSPTFPEGGGGGWSDGSLSGGAHGDVPNLLDRCKSAELNQEEAAEPLGIDVRTLRPWTRPT